ncbi:MAG TPA: MFS transporter [Burkholderiaceae bacterium]|nr:MFS transporter [Burkholderiaceae bacterium]
MRRVDPALIVILAGVSAALHVGKLPPALPVLRETLGLTLLQAGFLLSLVQLAGMTLGLAVGLAADGLGLKRSMVSGLLILFGAGALGGWALDVPAMLSLRAIEGFGFLLASMPAPSLIRLLVPPQRMNAMLGLWGAYMPFGTAVALLCGPFVIAAAGWQTWWWILAALSLVMALWMWLALPSDSLRTAAALAQPTQGGPFEGWPGRLRQTLSSRGPWLVALTFAMYSGQWLAVIGFLPSIYAQAGLSAGISGALTALAALVNMGGNIVSGRLLQRGWQPEVLLWIGFATMGAAGLAAFAVVGGSALPLVPRYLAVLLFSMVGGMIPGTLFSLAVALAPSGRTVSTTVGWMQQWSSLGQFAGPPLVAWVAGLAGGWHWTWVVTGGCALAGGALALAIGRLLERRQRATAGASRQLGR